MQFLNISERLKFNKIYIKNKEWLDQLFTVLFNVINKSLLFGDLILTEI